MLITHRGLSGPAILQISSYWKSGDEFKSIWRPIRDQSAAFRDADVRNMTAARSAFHRVSTEAFRHALARFACSARLDEPVAMRNLNVRPMTGNSTPADTEGYEKAEVR